jgi:hypothetical protein
MKKTFGIALFALVAALSFAPAANAQSVRFGVSIGNSHGNHGGYDHRGGYDNRGYDHRGGYDNRGYDHRGYDHRGGIGIDIRIGRPGIYIPAPVYRDRGGCYDGCGRGYEYTPAPINVRVVDFEPVYDRYGRRCGEREVIRNVVAYWDNARGGYFYVNRFGEYVRVN